LAVPLTFLKFARGAEREADYLGLQYTYSSGYDPLALIDFLERLSEHERKGNLPKVFSSHPMSKERIKRAQEEIAQVLPARTDYVVSTSRFDQVKARLLHWRHVNSLYEPSEQGGPRLRRRTQESQP
ncbi:MAG: M48 family metalloprotease, partial [Candidatus Acidiferrales bacterium]